MQQELSKGMLFTKEREGGQGEVSVSKCYVLDSALGSLILRHWCPKKLWENRLTCLKLILTSEELDSHQGVGWGKEGSALSGSFFHLSLHTVSVATWALTYGWTIDLSPREFSCVTWNPLDINLANKLDLE